MKILAGSFGRGFATLAVTLCAAFLNAASAQSPPLEIPFIKDWAASPHARITDEAFIHWNDKGEIPKACAKCHSTPGFRDFIGADGSKAGVVDKPAPVGTVISCVACHNKVTMKMDSVTFPSGVKVAGVGDDARCMTCHQGRESTISMNKALVGLDADKVSNKLKFKNIHYRAAGATRFGTQVKGAYEYAGKTYKGLYVHDKDSTKCADCHEQHTVKVEVAACDTCHRQVKAKKNFQDIRRSKGDFDGNGNDKEGIAKEIAGLHAALNTAIQSYGKKVAGTPIAYGAHNYPYFFVDKNGNGKADRAEAKRSNSYKSWTPRLLRAAYNYQFIAKDPGAYAHNPIYVIQVLHDSLADLSAKVTVNMAGMVRPKP